ncbi:MAG TPA: ATP-binding protein, partial [Kofleriaceae bacterium]
FALAFAELGLALDRRVGDRHPSELLGAPELYAPKQRALMKLLRSCAPAAFQAEPVLAGFCTAQMVMTSLIHGHSPESAQAYCSLAGILVGSDLHSFALAFAELGLALDRRVGDRVISTTVSFIYAFTISPWFHPLDESIRYMRQAYRMAREIGDHVVVGNAASQEISARVMLGAEPLGDILADARQLRQHVIETGNPLGVRLLTWEIDRLRVLTGELESMTAEDPDSQSSLLAIRGEANAAHQFLLLNILVDVAYSTGDPATALELATATRLLEASVSRMVVVTEHRFHHSLAAIAMIRRRPAMRGELEPVIEANQQVFAKLATEAPATFAPMYLTVAAERAAVDGRLGAAIELYDQALTAAARHGRRRIEALARELYGRMWIERGKPDIAQLYLSRARSAYLALGAHRKVRQLDREHRGLARGPQAPRLGGTITSNTAAEVLDVTAVAKATRAISGELELDKLLSIMLEIIFENAGAEGGALVRETAEGLSVAASRASGSSTISAVSRPLASAALPRSLIHYVLRTSTTVVLDDAVDDPRFGNDDDIRSRRPRSVLCMPVKHKDRLVAVLYLENTLVSGAFTPARLDALTILASQIAVSLENAELFAAQRVQAEELAGYRVRLEDLIAERTKELTLANQKLRDAAAERERIEAELRLAQKLESVGRLSAGIAHEINTPVQYVSDSLTFLREMLPSLIDTIGHYRTLATTVQECVADYDRFREAYTDYEAAVGDLAIVNRDRLVVALGRARDAEAEADVDYALDNAPTSITAALDGLGRVAAIVRSMKDFAHPDRDEKTLVDLNRAIESTLMIAANECKYVANVRTDLQPLPLVRCNGGEINQAVLNLVINAAHAIRDVVGQSGDKGTITVRTRPDGDEVEIAISDTGTGIPPSIRDKIYDPFFTTKEVGRGTGQGLAIVRGVIVDKHGGSLKFDTEAGRGTTFYIRLPLGDALESAA